MRAIATERASGDAGTTLIEVLVAVALLGIASTAILTGLVTFNSESNRHREQSTAITVLTYATETLTSSAVAYQNCATVSSYTPAALTNGFDFATFASAWPSSTVAVQSVRYWNGAAFDTTCRDNGSDRSRWLQEITVRVTSPDDKAHAEIVVVKRPTT
jgi:prepilin-type N-terminal cleavage/methylation domain-containing protein